MSQQNTLQSAPPRDMAYVDISDVVFEDPDKKESKQLQSLSKDNSLFLAGIAGLILLIVFLIGFGCDSFAVCVGSAACAVIVLPLILLSGNQMKAGVRYCTILDYYEKETSDYTYYIVTLRLDDTGEVIRDLSVSMRLNGTKTVGRQVLLAKIKRGTRYEYIVFPSEKHAPPQIGEATYMQNSAQPVLHSTTIDEIQFYSLPEKIRQQFGEAGTNAADLTGVYIRVIASKLNVVPMRITFVVDDTGQTVMDHHIMQNFCGMHPEGHTAILVRDRAYNYSLYPADSQS